MLWVLMQDKKKKRHFGTEPTYHTLCTCGQMISGQDSTHNYDCIYIAFCLEMVYFTPIEPML